MIKGYYALVQFCPDRARLEAANVGVLLYCPAAGYLDVKMSRVVGRVQKFFGSDAIDAKRFDILRRSFETRLRTSARGFETLKDLEAFINQEANEIQLTTPRPISVDTPGVELEALFDRLVGAPPAGLRRRAGVFGALDEEFSKPPYETLVRRSVEITLPVLGAPLTIPYGFQNGRFNLIQPASFTYESGVDLLARTGRFQLESELIYKGNHVEYGPMQLVVVGEFARGDEDTARRVEALLKDKHARFYRAEELPQLVREVRQTAKPIFPPTRLPGVSEFD